MNKIMKTAVSMVLTIAVTICSFAMGVSASDDLQAILLDIGMFMSNRPTYPDYNHYNGSFSSVLSGSKEDMHKKLEKHNAMKDDHTLEECLEPLKMTSTGMIYTYKVSVVWNAKNPNLYSESLVRDEYYFLNKPVKILNNGDMVTQEGTQGLVYRYSGDGKLNQEIKKGGSILEYPKFGSKVAPLYIVHSGQFVDELGNPIYLNGDVAPTSAGRLVPIKDYLQQKASTYKDYPMLPKEQDFLKASYATQLHDIMHNPKGNFDYAKTKKFHECKVDGCFFETATLTNKDNLVDWIGFMTKVDYTKFCYSYKYTLVDTSGNISHKYFFTEKPILVKGGNRENSNGILQLQKNQFVIEARGNDLASAEFHFYSLTSDTDIYQPLMESQVIVNYGYSVSTNAPSSSPYVGENGEPLDFESRSNITITYTPENFGGKFDFKDQAEADKLGIMVHAQASDDYIIAIAVARQSPTKNALNSVAEFCFDSAFSQYVYNEKDSDRGIQSHLNPDSNGNQTNVIDRWFSVGTSKQSFYLPFKNMNIKTGQPYYLTVIGISKKEWQGKGGRLETLAVILDEKEFSVNITPTYEEPPNTGTNDDYYPENEGSETVPDPTLNDDFFEKFGNLLSDLIKGLSNISTQTQGFFAFLGSTFSFIPQEIWYLITLGIGAVIVLRIIGR